MYIFFFSHRIILGLLSILGSILFFNYLRRVVQYFSLILTQFVLRRQTQPPMLFDDTSTPQHHPPQLQLPPPPSMLPGQQLIDRVKTWKLTRQKRKRQRRTTLQGFDTPTPPPTRPDQHDQLQAFSCDEEEDPPSVSSSSHQLSTASQPTRPLSSAIKSSSPPSVFSLCDSFSDSEDSDSDQTSLKQSAVTMVLRSSKPLYVTYFLVSNQSQLSYYLPTNRYTNCRYYYYYYYKRHQEDQGKEKILKFKTFMQSPMLLKIEDLTLLFSSTLEFKKSYCFFSLSAIFLKIDFLQ